MRRRLIIGVVTVVFVAAGVGTASALLLDAPMARYTVEGTDIIGPGDDPFVPVGMNLMGPDGFFNADAVTSGLAGVVKDAWKANTVRLNACLPDGCPYTGVHNTRNNDLDGIVEEFTGEGLVTMIALHQVEPGTWPDDGTLDEIERWWRDKARRYKANGRVWFNLLNEPGSGTPADRRWLEIHARLVRAIRDEGAPNLIVVDGTQWGQDAGGSGTDDVDTDNSAILSFGDDLREIDENVVFSFHVYDQWGEPEADDGQRDARLANYIDRVHRAGHALLIGETGGLGEPCCEPASLAVSSAFRVAPGRGVGILAWHGQAVDELRLVSGDFDQPTSPDAIDNRRDPGNLTWQGQLLWDLTHQ